MGKIVINNIIRAHVIHAFKNHPCRIVILNFMQQHLINLKPVNNTGFRGVFVQK